MNAFSAPKRPPTLPGGARARLRPAPHARCPRGPLAVGHRYALGGGIGPVYVEARLGGTPAALVYLVRSPQRSGPWVLKVVDLALRSRAELASGLALQRRCAGPRVVAALITHVCMRRAYILYEHVAGGDVGRYIDETVGDVTPLTLRTRLEIARTMFEAVAHCHARGVLHRDIKPENFMLIDRAAPAKGVKLIDFDLACTHGAGQSVGTTPYMAPEALRGEAVDAAADVFSLGVSLYRLLVGIEPFYDDDETQVARQILTQAPAHTLDDLQGALALLGADRMQTQFAARLITAMWAPAAQERCGLGEAQGALEAWIMLLAD